jgi:hypothetical protein
MNYEDVTQAVEEAQRVNRAVDLQSRHIAKLIVGRLRTVGDTYQGYETLKELKRELTQFNAATGTWKS